MPNLRCESHHRICNLRYGMSAYIGFCCSYSGLTDFIDTIPRLLYTKPTSKSQTKQYAAISKYNCFFLIVPVCKSKISFLVMEYISSIIAVSARDSILMKNSMHMNCNMDYYSILSCIFDRKNSLYALKNTTHSIIIKGERD